MPIVLIENISNNNNSNYNFNHNDLQLRLNYYFVLTTTVIIITQDNNYLCQIIRQINYGTDLSNTPVNRLYT